MDQRGDPTGPRAPHLRPTWAREPRESERTLTPIGRANSNADRRWKQGRVQQRVTGTPVWGAGNAPPRQETPFIQGVNVLQRQADRREGGEISTQTPTTSSTWPTFNPRNEPNDAHPQQLWPTPSIYKLAQTLLQKDVKEWKMRDFTTPGTSDGRSILISMFVDYAAMSLKPEMTLSQRQSLAQISLATAPEQILEYIQDPDEAIGFVNWALTQRVKIPPSMEMALCPLAAPNLITNQTLRDTIETGDLPVEIQKQLINTFIQCYYPKSEGMVMDVINSLPQNTLREYIECPGGLVKGIREGMKRTMAFAPPKWCRLSIHPDTVIQTTPRKSTRAEEWKKLAISLTDVELKVNTNIDTLVTLPLPEKRTIILSAIPMIFQDRISRNGCSEAFHLFETASDEEIVTFLQGGRHTTYGDTAHQQQQWKETKIYRYLVRLDHSNRRQNGAWEKSAGEILRTWINAIHPVLKSNDFSLLLTLHPFARTPVDRLIFKTPFELETYKIEKHTLVKNRGTQLTRFEVWIKTSCEHLEDMMDMQKSGPQAAVYQEVLTNTNITPEYITRIPDNIIPIAMIGGSIESASDTMIEEEIVDRLAMADFDTDDIPPFYVESTFVNTSTGRTPCKVKGILTSRQDAQKMQKMLTRFTTPASRKRYLVTRDYSFTPVIYPPTDRSDKELATAIKRQKSFLASNTRTTIYGLTGIDPFFDIPEQTKDLRTQVTISNTTKTVAFLLLTMTMLEEDGRTLHSPVTQVSTNRLGTKLYLTALKTDAAELIKFTREVIGLLEVWYAGNTFKPVGDIDDARQYVEPNQTLSPMQQQAENTSINRKWGGTQVSTSTFRVRESAANIVQSAQREINNNFVQGTQSPATIQTEGLNNPQHNPSGAGGDTTRNEVIQQELTKLKDMSLAQTYRLDEIAKMVQSVFSVDQGPKFVTNDEMVSTITTMLESNIHSSLSSSSDIANSCKSLVEEHTRTIRSLVQENTREIIQVCENKYKIGNEVEKLRELVTRQEETALQTSVEIKELKEQNAIILQMLTAQQDCTRQTGGTTNLMKASHDDKTDGIEDGVTNNLLDYDAEVRKRALDVLSLVDKMPLTKSLGGKQGSGTSDTNTSTWHQTAARIQKTSCNQCGQQGLGLIYCDKCEPPRLYHAHCMTFKEDEMTHICQECGHRGAEPTRQTQTEEGKGLGTEGKVQSPSKDVDTLEEDTADDTPEKSDMSTSTSDSSSSSGASTEEYKPRQEKQTPRTRTLPTLTPTSHEKNPPHSGAHKFKSPMQTRAQRLAKTTKPREDAFDTEDEDDTQQK